MYLCSVMNFPFYNLDELTFSMSLCFAFLFVKNTKLLQKVTGGNVSMYM